MQLAAADYGDFILAERARRAVLQNLRLAFHAEQQLHALVPMAAGPAVLFCDLVKMENDGECRVLKLVQLVLCHDLASNGKIVLIFRKKRACMRA